MTRSLKMRVVCRWNGETEKALQMLMVQADHKLDKVQQGADGLRLSPGAIPITSPWHEWWRARGLRAHQSERRTTGTQ